MTTIKTSTRSPAPTRAHGPRTVRRGLSAMRSVLKDRSGLAGVEFAMIFPLFAGLFLGGVSAYDMYRYNDTLERGVYTLADLVSREVQTSDDRLELIHDTFIALVNGQEADYDVTVTSIERNYDAKNDTWSLKGLWRYSSQSGASTKNPTDFDASRIPEIADNETALIIEVTAKHDVMLNFYGDEKSTFQRATTISPRYTRSIANVDAPEDQN